jgi:hypothetical protein
MALEATFRNLTTCLHEVDEVISALHVTMEEPERGHAAVADDLAEKTLELVGMAHEAQRAADNARKALDDPQNLDQARRNLTACQERFYGIKQKLSADLASHKTATELARVAGRSKQWAAWAKSARRGIEDCRRPLEQASEALAVCWQELAERLGTTKISMQATNVGQQITLSRSRDRDRDRDRNRNEDLEAEGVT